MTNTIIELIAQRGGKVPTSTVHQSRLQIFQATRRPVPIEQTLETAWGKVRIKGRLGQQHADLLEAIMHTGERPKGLMDGRIKLLVDQHKLSKITRLESATLRRTIDDLMQALLEIREPEHLAGIGHLVDHIDFARRADGSYVTVPDPLCRARQKDGGRKLWKVELGKVLCQMIEADMWRSRDPVHIASLRHGISQAVARHVLSHAPGTCKNWQVDTLIKAVASALTPQDFRNRRREIREDEGALAALGVEFAIGGK